LSGIRENLDRSGSSEKQIDSYLLENEIDLRNLVRFQQPTISSSQQNLLAECMESGAPPTPEFCAGPIKLRAQLITLLANLLEAEEETFNDTNECQAKATIESNQEEREA
jgi:hypothetical protein